MMSNLFVDLETIPLQGEERREVFTANLTPPGNLKKEETIAKWRVDAAEKAIAKTSFDPIYGEVCCIGYAWDDEEVKSYTYPGNEADLIKEVFDQWEVHASAIHNDFPTVIGHNVLDFDLRFLYKKAILHGIRLPKWWPRDFKRWDSRVFDTMLRWDDRRDQMIGLDTLAKAMGIEGKNGVDGSMVAEMYERGEILQIMQYCEEDVSCVRKIYTKMKEVF